MLSLPYQDTERHGHCLGAGTPQRLPCRPPHALIGLEKKKPLSAPTETTEALTPKAQRPGFHSQCSSITAAAGRGVNGGRFQQHAGKTQMTLTASEWGQLSNVTVRCPSMGLCERGLAGRSVRVLPTSSEGGPSGLQSQAFASSDLLRAGCTTQRR